MAESRSYYRVLVQGSGVNTDLGQGSRSAGFYKVVVLAAQDAESAEAYAVNLCAQELRKRLGDSAMRFATLAAVETQEVHSIPEQEPGFTWYHE
jgi:hypothetical protein